MSWNVASSMPGMSALVWSSTRVIANASPTLCSLTLATVSTRFDLIPSLGELRGQCQREAAGVSGANQLLWIRRRLSFFQPGLKGSMGPPRPRCRLLGVHYLEPGCLSFLFDLFVPIAISQSRTEAPIPVEAPAMRTVPFEGEFTHSPLLGVEGGKDCYCRARRFCGCRMAASIFAAHPSHAKMKSTTIVVAGRSRHTSHGTGLTLVMLDS